MLNGIKATYIPVGAAASLVWYLLYKPKPSELAVLGDSPPAESIHTLYNYRNR